MKVQISEELAVAYNETFTIREQCPIDGEKRIMVHTKEDAVKLATELLKWAQSQGESND